MYARKWLFPNMLGVSVVCHENSVGYDIGLFEVAILIKSMNCDGYGMYLNLDNCCFTAVGLILRDVCMIDSTYFGEGDFDLNNGDIMIRPASMRRVFRIVKDNEKYWKKIRKESLKDSREWSINERIVPIDR